jgi:hypothetical protein
VTKYYHVMKKNGAWHLYAGNSPAALVSNSERARVISAARSLARQNGARIVLHKSAADGAYAPGGPSVATSPKRPG